MDLTELQECLDGESATSLIEVLDQAGISHRRSVGSPAFDVSNLGSSGGAPVAKIIISIPRDDFKKARAALEEESLKNDLSEDHYLHHSSEEELLDMISHEREWSAFDIAHAKHLLSEKGIELPDPKKVAAKRMAALQKGKPVSGKLRFLG